MRASSYAVSINLTISNLILAKNTFIIIAIANMHMHILLVQSSPTLHGN
jgi:hypothetical protein